MRDSYPAGYPKHDIRRMISPEYSPLCYLAGALLILAVFVAYPILRVLYMSLMHNVLTRPDQGIYFVGLGNFLSLLQNADFLMAFQRTVWWTLLSVAGKTVIGFIIALLLVNITRGKKLFIFLLFIPWVTPNVVGAITWRWIFDGQFGMLNWLLLQLQLISQPISWLSSNFYSFLFTALVDVWVGVPFMAIVFMGGLQMVSQEILESADMDGAGYFKKLFYIKLPVIRPIVLVATTLSAIWTFNSFQIIWPLTRGGPVSATETLIIKAYRLAFGSFDIGMGSAVAVIIFLVLLAFSAFYNQKLSETD
jgi:multiple sugar transport system permease protein